MRPVPRSPSIVVVLAPVELHSPGRNRGHPLAGLPSAPETVRLRPAAWSPASQRRTGRSRRRGSSSRLPSRRSAGRPRPTARASRSLSALRCASAARAVMISERKSGCIVHSPRESALAPCEDGESRQWSDTPLMRDGARCRASWLGHNGSQQAGSPTGRACVYPASCRFAASARPCRCLCRIGCSRDSWLLPR